MDGRQALGVGRAGAEPRMPGTHLQWALAHIKAQQQPREVMASAIVDAMALVSGLSGEDRFTKS